MTKIVINVCYGGFGLSPLAEKMYLKAKGKECYFYHVSNFGSSYDDCDYEQLSIDDAEKEHFKYTMTRDLGKIHKGKLPNDAFFMDGGIERDDPDLIKVVEELGKDANDDYSELEIVEIPDDVDWEIDEYDGRESIHEKHRSWS